jgi:hypothetical protein
MPCCIFIACLSVIWKTFWSELLVDNVSVVYMSRLNNSFFFVGSGKDGSMHAGTKMRHYRPAKEQQMHECLSFSRTNPQGPGGEFAVAEALVGRRRKFCSYASCYPDIENDSQIWVAGNCEKIWMRLEEIYYSGCTAASQLSKK